MTRIALAAAVTALAASLSLASAGSVDEPADGWIYDAMAAPVTVSYTGTVQEVRIGSRGSEASVYRIEHLAPNLTVRFYISPPALHGDSVIVKGKENYDVDARRHRIVENQNDAANDQIALDDNYILMRANYRAIKQSSESFDGRDVRTVALINNYTHGTTMQVRIDRATKLVLDKQVFASDGSLLSEVRFQDVRYTRAIPASDFDLPKQYAMVRGMTFDEPSDDVPAVLRRAGFAARGPKFLPDGFSPVEAHVAAIRAVSTLHLLYSDGIRTVSLFENSGEASGMNMDRLHPQATTVAGHDAQFADEGPMTLLTWNDGALRYVLVGDLRLDELKRIAASVSP